MVACTYPGLIAASHVLHLFSSQAILQLASAHQHIQSHITRLYTTIIASAGFRLPATSFTGQFPAQLHLCVEESGGIHHPNLCSKEVIRPQVPLRSPCYDFSLVAKLVFDDDN